MTFSVFDTTAGIINYYSWERQINQRAIDTKVSCLIHIQFNRELINSVRT